MDPRIEKLIKYTHAAIGLDNYDLHSTGITLEHTLHSTEPVLTMEWLPKKMDEPLEDGTNPIGTAVIDLGIKSGQFRRIIFVGGKTYANKLKFDHNNIESIILWIEQQTSLAYNKQFTLQKRERGRFVFHSSYEGTPVSPSGHIEFELDDEGHLVFFSKHGDFPLGDPFMIEDTELFSIDQDIFDQAYQQIKLVQFPSSEQEKWVQVYALEEVYITADKKKRIPFELKMREAVIIDQALTWEEPSEESFNGKPLFTDTERLTADQAFAFADNPLLQTLTERDRTLSIKGVLDLLRKAYPTESGKWKLYRLYREEPYIIAELKPNQEVNQILQRKINVFIDSSSYEAVNYIDNHVLLQAFDHFEAPGEAGIKIDEAFEKLKTTIVFEPVYVYDFDLQKYVLCGKLDSEYGILATSGEIVKLSDL